MGNWFVLMPDQSRQRGKEILRTDNYFVMICFEGLRYQPCVLKFICFTLLKRNGEGLDWFGNHPTHNGGDG